MKITADWIDYAENYHGTMGSAHCVTAEEPKTDAAEQVREVAEEVSGKTMPVPPARRIGF